MKCDRHGEARVEFDIGKCPICETTNGFGKSTTTPIGAVPWQSRARWLAAASQIGMAIAEMQVIAVQAGGGVLIQMKTNTPVEGTLQLEEIAKHLQGGLSTITALTQFTDSGLIVPAFAMGGR